MMFPSCLYWRGNLGAPRVTPTTVYFPVFSSGLLYLLV